MVTQHPFLIIYPAFVNETFCFLGDLTISLLRLFRENRGMRSLCAAVLGRGDCEGMGRKEGRGRGGLAFSASHMVARAASVRPNV